MQTLIQIQIIQFLQFESETIAPDAGLGSLFFVLRNFIQIVNIEYNECLKAVYNLKNYHMQRLIPHLVARSFSISCRHLVRGHSSLASSILTRGADAACVVSEKEVTVLTKFCLKIVLN